MNLTDSKKSNIFNIMCNYNLCQGKDIKCKNEVAVFKNYYLEMKIAEIKNKDYNKKA